jgi:hypothetical protein
LFERPEATGSMLYASFFDGDQGESARRSVEAMITVREFCEGLD